MDSGTIFFCNRFIENYSHGKKCIKYFSDFYTSILRNNLDIISLLKIYSEHAKIWRKSVKGSYIRLLDCFHFRFCCSILIFDDVIFVQVSTYLSVF